MSFETKALITDNARQRIAEGWATGKSFAVVGFSLGSAGHDPFDPRTALAPDPSLMDCPSVAFGPKAIASFSYANDTCPVFECRLEFGEAVVEYSSLCLIAQILYSPVPGDPEVDTTFLFAVVNFPLRSKTDLEELVINVGVSR